LGLSNPEPGVRPGGALIGGSQTPIAGVPTCPRHRAGAWLPSRPAHHGHCGRRSSAITGVISLATHGKGTKYTALAIHRTEAERKEPRSHGLLRRLGQGPRSTRRSRQVDDGPGRRSKRSLRRRPVESNHPYGRAGGTGRLAEWSRAVAGTGRGERCGEPAPDSTGRRDPDHRAEPGGLRRRNVLSTPPSGTPRRRGCSTGHMNRCPLEDAVATAGGNRRVSPCHNGPCLRPLKVEARARIPSVPAPAMTLRRLTAQAAMTPPCPPAAVGRALPIPRVCNCARSSIFNQQATRVPSGASDARPPPWPDRLPGPIA
jgi:hypothetical protein